MLTPLSPGDWITVVAPSGPIPVGAFWSGVAWLRERYRVRLTSAVLSRTGFLAGDDARRSNELARAFEDDAVRAIVAARGGYGATRILRHLPWELLRRRPKWIVGFSDITALHACAWTHGLASVHGANVTGLGYKADARTRATWMAALETPSSRPAWRDLRVVHDGDARGVLVGGNVTVLGALAASAQLRLPKGAVLALEDVGERPYRLDRTMTSLLEGGFLRDVSAIVLGEFSECEPGADGVTAMDVMKERLAPLGVPIVANAPFGHGTRNDAFVLGAEVRVRGDTIEWQAD